MAARLGTPDDAPELTRLRALMLESVGAPVDDEWSDACIAALREGIAEGTYVAFVVDAPDGDGLVACGVASVAQRLPSMVNRSGRIGYVHSMSTDPGHRRSGHAREVLVAIMGWFEQEGIVVVELHATDMGAQLYRSFGFSEASHVELRWHAPLP